MWFYFVGIKTFIGTKNLNFFTQPPSRNFALVCYMPRLGHVDAVKPPSLGAHLLAHKHNRDYTFLERNMIGEIENHHWQVQGRRMKLGKKIKNTSGGISTERTNLLHLHESWQINLTRLKVMESIWIFKLS